MNTKLKLSLETLSIVALLLLSMASNPLTAATTAPLTREDFRTSSFAKVVDFVDFARAHASEQGLTPPASNVHVYVYTVWINTSGIQVFYTGMVNMTNGGPYFTIPMQSFLEHFKSQQGKDVLVSSSFLSLLSFKEGSNTIHADSPDRNDTVYASFSLGTSIPALTNQPRQNNSATIIPLTSSSNGLSWSWGMTYNDLTAVWWKISPDHTNPTWDGARPVAVTTYSELTFTYNLVLDPATRTATMQASFVVGEMTHLWYIDWTDIFNPVAVHYNNTGNYYTNGTQRGSETIHQFASAQNFKLSIVLYQSVLIVGHSEHSDDSAGRNATDAEHDVSSGSITTSAEDNERIFRTDFGTKEQYQLVNSTSGQTTTHDANTRTVRVYGYAGNHAFDVQLFFVRLMAYSILAFHPRVWTDRTDLDIVRASFIYVISYPSWGGYKVVHDPTYTAYYTPTTGVNLAFLALLGIAAVAILGGAIVFTRRRHVSLPASPAAH